MPLEQDSPNSGKRVASNAEAAPMMRAQEQRSQRRRRWVMQSLSLVILSSVVLCMIVMWKRDHVEIEEALSGMAPFVHDLQNHFDQDGLLPALPNLPDDSAYLSVEERFYARQTSNPVIVAYRPSRTFHKLILLSNGRVVLILEGGKLRAEWMTHSEFDEVMELQIDQIKAFEAELESRPVVLPD